ncbi:nucleoside triphosphatase [Schizosaccharomyces octosporus yFS286]|uniref:Inosine triphosphate pyrophosphatase n=1 Tax=Schizosaccharomyces octosporus (strain yFS286) TaxID=483514 RepID=S9Q1B2_SCHOY|nr:nucleoside triphosphatase [Schizosaccharomyces octosporus yFS286]EPX73503.1 nucleoside triphosphatase [Schizosaccharomyces octosporus yFS286]
MPAPRSILFVTGNKHKLADVTSILGSEFEIKNHSYDLPEIQGSLQDIVTEKCKAAAEIVKGPVLTEDTWLSYDAMNDLPGPYIKWFLNSIGCDGLYHMLDGFSTKAAKAGCTFGYTEGPGKPIHMFDGILHGEVVAPRGDKGFGWNAIFQPRGHEKTYAEMDDDERNACSHRFLAAMKLRDFLQAQL